MEPVSDTSLDVSFSSLFPPYPLLSKSRSGLAPSTKASSHNSFRRVIELWTGLICGCLPALRPFLHYIPSLPSRFSLTSLVHSREKKSYQSDSKSSSNANPKHHSYTSQNGVSWFKGGKGSTNRSDLTTTTDGTYVELSEPNTTRTYVKGGGTHTLPTPSSSSEQIYPGAVAPGQGGIARTVEVDVSKSHV